MGWQAVVLWPSQRTKPVGLGSVLNLASEIGETVEQIKISGAKSLVASESGAARQRSRKDSRFSAIQELRRFRRSGSSRQIKSFRERRSPCLRHGCPVGRVLPAMDKCSANIMSQLCGKLPKTRESSPFHFGSEQLGPSLLGCRENLRQPFGTRLGTEIAMSRFPITNMVCTFICSATESEDRILARPTIVYRFRLW